MYGVWQIASLRLDGLAACTRACGAACTNTGAGRCAAGRCLQGRIAELEALVEVQGNRIRTALAENAKLTEKVKR